MNLKNIFAQLNFPAQCRKYGLSLWQCPQFLFLIMGIIILGSALITYAIGNRYIEDPEIVTLIVLLLTLILFIIAFTISRSFERLAEANRMKSEFISVVSHQLRSPLSNLRWAIEILTSGRISSVNEKQAEYFKILKENSSRMRELVSDLLIVSRIEQGALPLKKKEISLEELIKETIKEFELFAGASNIEIKFKTSFGLPKILTDSSRLKLVIENLIDNAIRYMPARQSSETDKLAAGRKKQGEIKIKLEKRKKNLYFEIKDNGAGIPKEDQKYIFQKFFRSENILRYQTQGSGLGLYISKSIIKKLGGKISFQSQEDLGSTFWFTLPIK